jgi:four helix bundle protein
MMEFWFPLLASSFMLRGKEQEAGMKTPAKTFQDLEVWKNSHAFVLDVYRLTATFPTDERFGMISQFRRAAVSIPANIAEGFRKYTPADKARFFTTAEGSLEECRYYCILARDLEYGDTLKLQKALDVIAAQLATYLHCVHEK